MAGQNLFPRGRSLNEKLATGRDRSCVFVSHDSSDKDFARCVAKALMEMNVDVYFDEYDVGLGGAVAAGDDVAIAKCVEEGLDRSTHLLGVLSPNSFESWWVPYEIGGAHGRRQTVAHVVHFRVENLPSYVQLATIINTQGAFRRWTSERSKR